MDSIIVIGSRKEKREAHLHRFRAAGLLPVPVASVESAVSLLHQFSVVAVVMLAGPPDRVEWEQCARLVATGTPVVLIPQSATPEAIQRHLAAGCAAVMPEPLDARDLSAAIR